MNVQDPLAAWISGLDAEDARDMLIGAATRSNEVYDWLDGVRVSSSDAPGDLLELVNRALKPTRRFYDYWQTNEYADACFDTVQLLVASAEHATASLLPAIERAITLLTRAILKADDSSGMLGDRVRKALDAHALAVRTAAPPLTAAEQKRVVRWIVKYRYGGTQDFFDPDIVAYAPGLSQASIEQYRAAIEATDLGQYGRYPLTRLAVLGRDLDEIIAARGGEPHNAMLAKSLVEDLLEAGLVDDAVRYAKLGVEMEHRGWDRYLIDFLVETALHREEDAGGSSVEAVRLRRDWLARFPGTGAFDALKETAESVGAWEAERPDAERALAEHSAAAFARYLLQVRPDDAWDYALANVPLRVSELPVEVPAGTPELRKAAVLAVLQKRRPATLDAHLWSELCSQRELSDPSSTLPVYRALIDEVLVTTAKQNYRDAAQLLKRLRSASDRVGGQAPAEFTAFLGSTVERNRRRPTCIAAFKRAGLIS